MKNLLIIFAKAPEPGRVKTRLVPFISPEVAADLQEAFLMDMLKMSQDVKSARLIACSPDTRHAFFQRCEKEEGIRLIGQEGEDLGERMQRAFQQAFSEGFKRVVIIGCDSPTLPAAYIEEAFLNLERNSAVLGPSLDGGYYLIGAKAPLPQLFDRIDWSTETVLNETLKRLNATKKPFHLLPFWYDIDLPADLIFLKQHLNYLKMKGEAGFSVTTETLESVPLNL